MPSGPRYGVLNLPIPRPRLGVFIPVFPVKLKNGSKEVIVDVGFDTGMQGSHLQMPASMARSFGIQATGSEPRADATQRFTAYTGTIDSISAPDSPGCVIRNAKVLFYENAPLLVGNLFMNELSAEISYNEGVPSLTCGAPTESAGDPVFPVLLTHDGVTHQTDALFDTGFDGADVLVPSSFAYRLGLDQIGTVKAGTHTGTVSLGRAKLDLLALRDVPCALPDAEILIFPPESHMDVVIVGEDFMKKVNGKIGYDSNGAFFACRGTPAIARSVAIVPAPPLPEINTLEKHLPLIIGAVAAAATIGVGLYLFSNR